jgi:hypothetical protein
MNRAYDSGLYKAASALGLSPEAAELVGLGLLGAIPTHHLLSHALGYEEDPAVAGPVDASLDLLGLGTLAIPALEHLRQHGA